jgi:hypothetical protein
MDEVRDFCEDWRVDYNTERPHKSLGYLPPAMFAEQWYQRSKYAQQLYPQMGAGNPSNIEGSHLVDKIFEKPIVEPNTLLLN